MPMLGPWELIVILVIVVVIFGAGRLSDVGGALGKSIREFRKATSDESHHSSTAATAQVAPPVAPAAPLAAGPVVAADSPCPSCGTVNPAVQSFCGQCGTRLTRAA